MIRAAGGAVWRVHHRWQVEVLVVHRPHRRDWSLPKGKLHRGESAVECALREVREETGLRCVLGDELPAVRYIDRKGNDKLVRYWAMEELEGEFRPNHEVDEVRWVALDRLVDVLTYGRDLTVVSALRVLAGAVA